MIILDRKFSVNPDVICSESEDSTVLLYRDKLYVLNETAAWLWFRIDDNYFIDLVHQLIDVIQDENDTRRIQNDCKNIILDWIEAELVIQKE